MAENGTSIGIGCHWAPSADRQTRRRASSPASCWLPTAKYSPLNWTTPVTDIAVVLSSGARSATWVQFEYWTANDGSEDTGTSGEGVGDAGGDGLGFGDTCSDWS